MTKTDFLFGVRAFRVPTPHARKGQTENQTSESKDAVAFDRARSLSLNGAVRAGLGSPNGRGTLGVSRRDERDRKQGTPVTAQLMGDPAPDRLERAEALRQALVAKTNRFKIEGSADEGLKIRTAYDGRKPRSSTPLIPEPRGKYIEPPLSARKIAGRRGTRVLYFATVRDAHKCLLNEDPGASGAYHIKNAVGGVTKSAYGWTWERLMPGRRGRGGGRWSE